MNKRWLAVMVVIISIALIAGFAIAFAKQEKAEKGKWGKAKEMYTEKGMQSPWQKLNLTDEQKEKMKEKKLVFMKETLPIRNELGIKRIELQELWSKDEPDAKAIIAKQKEIGKLTEELAEKSVNHRIAMGKIFTPEQKKMFKTGIDKMMAHRKMGVQGRFGMRRGMGMSGGISGGMEMGKGSDSMGCCGMDSNCPMKK